MICASYERVSTRAQGQYGFSLGAQHQSLEEFARTQGWRLPEHLRFRDGEDEDASGADWDLPDLNRMLAAASRREFQVLVVPDFDRFARSMVKGLVLEEQLKKHGVRVAFQRVPVENTPEGNLLKTQLYAFAEYDRQKIILRTTMGRRAKAQTGKVVGAGPAPYGYRYIHETLPNGKVRVCGLGPDPATERIAREALLMLRVRSATDVVADLNRRGIPGRRGGPWNSEALYRMGRNPVYCGEWRYAGIVVPIPPLVAPNEWAEIQAALDRRRVARRGRTPVEQDAFLLRGLLTCGHCRGDLRVAKSGGSAYRYYRCGRDAPTWAQRQRKPVCELPGLNADATEAELWRVLNATLLNEAYLAAGLAAARTDHDRANKLRRDRLAAIDAQIARHRKRLQAMVDELIDAGPETKAAIRRQMTETDGLISRLDGERRDLGAMRTDGLSQDEADAIVAFAAEVREGLAAATDADRRALYELLRIRGTVHADPNGVKLGRTQRFCIDWTAAIPLINSDGSFLKITTQHSRSSRPCRSSQASNCPASAISMASSIPMGVSARRV